MLSITLGLREIGNRLRVAAKDWGTPTPKKALDRAVGRLGGDAGVLNQKNKDRSAQVDEA